MDYDIIILGAGHNGLVAAFYLARAGRKVLIVEANPMVGGACVTEELIPGYRFSTCANLLWGLRPKIAQDLGLLKRGLKVDPRRFIRLIPNGEYVFYDRYTGSSTAQDAMAAIQRETAKVSAADAATLPRWQAFLDRLTRIFGPWLLREPPTVEQLRAACTDPEDRKALELVLRSSMFDLTRSFFESDFMRNGRAGADMGDGEEPGSALLLGLGTAMGAYTETGEPVMNGYIRGGMGRLTQLMCEAAVEQGAVVRTNCPVGRILTQGGKTTGVELASGEKISAPIVVSNADPKRTFLKLMAASDLDPMFRARVAGLQTHAAAGLKLHCVLSAEPEYKIRPGLSREQLREATAIFGTTAAEQRANWRAVEAGELPEVPTVAGFMPSIFDPSLAQPGRFTWSSYVTWAPVRLKRGTWDERKAEMAENIFRVMDRYVTNFRKSLIDYVLLTPADFERTRLLTDGNIHHVDATPNQVLATRPLPELAKYRSPIGGLYLCGSGTHPWGEVTGAPGHNAAHAVLADLGRTTQR